MTPTTCPCCGASYEGAILQTGICTFECDLCGFRFELEEYAYIETAEGLIGYAL